MTKDTTAQAVIETSREKKRRLVTRSDFDGLVCAILLCELEIIERNNILFVHPKDMQDGKVTLTDNDITTNLPYNPCVDICFDHHLSEITRMADILKEQGQEVGVNGQIQVSDNGFAMETPSNWLIMPNAPSAARVVYEFFGGKQAFPNIPEEMMIAVDKADSGQFDMDEILKPTDWALLNFIMDPRTGLGRFKDFSISNYDLMLHLIDACRKMSVKEILTLPDVQERVNLYFEHENKVREQLRNITEIRELENGLKIAVLDLREEGVIWCTNRFLIYALFPEVTLSVHVMQGLHGRNTVLAVGRSIFNKSFCGDVGKAMYQFAGGGHRNAGTCQVYPYAADSVLDSLCETFGDIDQIDKDYRL